MPTFDLYNPNIKKASFGDKLSDRFLGTNKMDLMNQQNQYEYWKAANINKYSYNVQGMVNAGINPLANTSGLNGSVSSPVTQNLQSNIGILGESIAKTTKNLLSHLEPNSKQETMDMIKTFLNFLK